MKLVAILLTALLPTYALADDKSAGRVYNDADAKVTHDCGKEPRVVINGAGGSYTFTGACEKIAINGSELKIAIESGAHVAINTSSTSSPPTRSRRPAAATW